jgi:hypothetical protein
MEWGILDSSLLCRRERDRSLTTDAWHTAAVGDNVVRKFQNIVGPFERRGR